MFMSRGNFLGQGSKSPSYKSKLKQLSSISIFLKIYIFDMKSKNIFTHFIIDLWVSMWFDWRRVDLKIESSLCFWLLKINSYKKSSSYEKQSFGYDQTFFRCSVNMIAHRPINTCYTWESLKRPASLKFSKQCIFVYVFIIFKNKLSALYFLVPRSCLLRIQSSPTCYISVN